MCKNRLVIDVNKRRNVGTVRVNKLVTWKQTVNKNSKQDATSQQNTHERTHTHRYQNINKPTKSPHKTAHISTHTPTGTLPRPWDTPTGPTRAHAHPRPAHAHRTREKHEKNTTIFPTSPSRTSHFFSAMLIWRACACVRARAWVCGRAWAWEGATPSPRGCQGGNVGLTG